MFDQTFSINVIIANLFLFISKIYLMICPAITISLNTKIHKDFSPDVPTPKRGARSMRLDARTQLPLLRQHQRPISQPSIAFGRFCTQNYLTIFKKKKIKKICRHKYFDALITCRIIGCGPPCKNFVEVLINSNNHLKIMKIV